MSSEGERDSVSLATIVASVLAGCEAGVDSDRRTGDDLGVATRLASDESIT